MAEPIVTQTTPPIHGLKLWQALLLYPSLIITLGGSIPTLWNEIRARQLGVESSQLQLVLHQQKLWERNIDCLSEQGRYEIDGPNSIVIKVSLCPKTGDVLVRYHLNEWAPIYRWVAKPGPKDLRKE